MTTTPATKSLLSKNDNATLTPRAKASKLARIAKRAQCKADWLDEQIAITVRHLALPIGEFYDDAEEADYYRELNVTRAIDSRTYAAKAARACDEIAAIAAAEGLTVRQLANS